MSKAKRNKRLADNIIHHLFPKTEMSPDLHALATRVVKKTSKHCANPKTEDDWFLNSLIEDMVHEVAWFGDGDPHGRRLFNLAIDNDCLKRRVAELDEEGGGSVLRVVENALCGVLTEVANETAKRYKAAR